jgi:hypothetical protein
MTASVRRASPDFLIRQYLNLLKLENFIGRQKEEIPITADVLFNEIDMS